MKKFLFSLLFLPSLLTAEVIETDLLARVQWGNGGKRGETGTGNWLLSKLRRALQRREKPLVYPG
jgi:hypothetical protein